MPTNVTKEQLLSVGLQTRIPDRFELCPAGFIILEDIPDTSMSTSRPQGRGRPKRGARGRPRSSRKSSSNRNYTAGSDIAYCDTTHHRVVNKKKPKCCEIADKVDSLKRVYANSSESESCTSTKTKITKKGKAKGQEKKKEKRPDKRYNPVIIEVSAAKKTS